MFLRIDISNRDVSIDDMVISSSSFGLDLIAFDVGRFLKLLTLKVISSAP